MKMPLFRGPAGRKGSPGLRRRSGRFAGNAFFSRPPPVVKGKGLASAAKKEYPLRHPEPVREYPRREPVKKREYPRPFSANKD